VGEEQGKFRLHCFRVHELTPRLKVMVLGKEGVGKTHILRRLQKVAYERNESTNGVDINTLLLRDKELTWFDFGGQEVFYPTHQVGPFNFVTFADSYPFSSF
jgi:GTPase SAR1 family protein